MQCGGDSFVAHRPAAFFHSCRAKSTLPLPWHLQRSGMQNTQLRSHPTLLTYLQTNGKAPKSCELLLFSDVVVQVYLYFVSLWGLPNLFLLNCLQARARILGKQIKFLERLWIRSSKHIKHNVAYRVDLTVAITPYTSSYCARSW